MGLTAALLLLLAVAVQLQLAAVAAGEVKAEVAAVEQSFAPVDTDCMKWPGGQAGRRAGRH